MSECSPEFPRPFFELDGYPDLVLAGIETQIRLQMMTSERDEALKRVETVSQERDEEAVRSRTDRLTGLRSRLGFEEAVSALIENDEPFAVVLSDVEDLTGANSLMHAYGDKLIIGAADSVDNASREEDLDPILGRFGGDEIVSVVRLGPRGHSRTVEMSDEERVQAACYRKYKLFQSNPLAQEVREQTGGIHGIYFMATIRQKGDKRGYEELLDDAGRNKAQAKKNPPGVVQFFTVD